MGSDDDLRLDTDNSLAQLLPQNIKLDAGATSSPSYQSVFQRMGLKNELLEGWCQMQDAPNRIFPNKLPIPLTVSSPSPAV